MIKMYSLVINLTNVISDQHLMAFTNAEALHGSGREHYAQSYGDDQKDPIAKQLLEEYNNVVMYDQNLL